MYDVVSKEKIKENNIKTKLQIVPNECTKKKYFYLDRVKISLDIKGLNQIFR